MRRVLCLGDSITYGTGSTPGNSYPEQLQRLLESRGLAAQVVSDGHPGASTRDLWDYLQAAPALPPAEAPLCSQPSYDAIIILVGTNDCRRDNWVETPDSMDYLERLISAVRPRLAVGGQLFLCSVLPLAQPMPFEIIGGQHPWEQDKVETEMNPGLRSLAQRHRLGWIDLHAAFQEALRLGQPVYDGIHPYDLGYALIARTCAEALSAHWKV